LTGWVAGSLVLAAFFFALWASLRVGWAVNQGALTRPVWSCLERRDAAHRDLLADRAFVRSVQAYLDEESSSTSPWHWHGLVALVGAHTRYSASDREAAMLPQLAEMPLCPRRG
jgi:hypothetical protein